MKIHDLNDSSAAFLSVSENQKETPHGSAGFPCAGYLDCYHRSSYPWHWHDELEIAYVTQGEVTALVPEAQIPLAPGEGIFLNRSVLHAYSAVAESHLPNLLFLPSLLYGSQESIFRKKYMNPLLSSSRLTHVILKPNVAWQADVLNRASEVFALLQEKDFGYEFRVRAALSEALLLLLRHTSCEADASPQTQTENERLRTMLRFIRQHYCEPIRIEQIAASANVSRRECMRCFQKGIRTSPIQYVIDLRIQKARRLLSETALPLSDIGASCGFSDQSYFIKTFRERSGLSPSAFRKNAAAAASGSIDAP